MARISLDGGMPGILFDGFEIGPDPRSPSILDATPDPVETDLGLVGLRRGTTTLRIEVAGKNDQASSYSWGSIASCSGRYRESDP